MADGAFLIHGFGFAAAFAAVLVLIPLIRRLALRIGFVDEPGGRKQHDSPVPPVGGLVIFPVFIAVSILGGVDLDAYGYLYIALVVLLTTGAIDDLLHMSAWIKFFIQIVVAFLVVVPGGARLDNLGNMFGFGDLHLGTGWTGWRAERALSRSSGWRRPASSPANPVRSGRWRRCWGRCSGFYSTTCAIRCATGPVFFWAPRAAWA
jgi:hypothetical protein